jgi:hypothetical protein
MQQFFLKIYKGDRDQAVHDILDTYESQGFAWINFFYFAYIKAQKLYLTKSTSQYDSKLQKKLRQKFNDSSLKKEYSKVFPSYKKLLP